MGNSTPDKTVTEEQTYPESAIVSGLSVIEAGDSVNFSGDLSAFEVSWSIFQNNMFGTIAFSVGNRLLLFMVRV